MIEPDRPAAPELAELDDPALADRVAELVDRLRRGEPIDLSDEDPRRAEELRRLLPTIHLMADLAGRDAPTLGPGVLGDFRILREIGRGGMGVIYEAEQISLGRRVALKVLPHTAALDSRQVRRFRVEAQAAACLHHPNIVPVFTVGAEGNTPFYAMQFIEGRDLSRVIRGWIDEASPPSSSRARSRLLAAAELARQAAEALAHAHQHEVLHRDIKPSNLLVDDAGRLWITDFGLARIQGELDLTRTGDNLGTPRYMSPEQALGRHTPLDARTDIYSLGATLYELATLRHAFAGEDRLTILRRIIEDQPAPPRRVDPSIPVDLETIILKAMARDPADRYGSADEMAEDLRRFLADRPILAQRPTISQRAARWARRNRRVAAGAAVLALAAALAVAAGTWRYTVWLRRYNTALRTEVARADRQAARATEAERRVQAAISVAREQRSLAERHLHAARLRQARQAIDERQLDLALVILDSTRTGLDGADLRGFAWSYLHARAAREVVLLPGLDRPLIAGMSITPDGRTLAAPYVGSPMALWDVPSRRAPRTITTEPRSELWAPRLSPDGRLLVFTDHPMPINERRHVWLRVHDVATGRPLAKWSIGSNFGKDHRTFAELADGGRLAAAAWRDLAEWTSLRVFGIGDAPESETPRVALDNLDAVALAPEKCLLAIVENGRLSLRDLDTGATVREIPGEFPEVRVLALSPGGRTLAAALPGRGVRTWDAADGAEGPRYDLAEPVRQVLFSPRGPLVAILEDSGRIHLWDRASGRSLRFMPDEMDRERDQVTVAFSPDGARVATTSHGTPGGYQPVAVWDVATGRRLGTLPCRTQDASNVLFLPDSRELIVDIERAPRIWRFDPPAEPGQPSGHADEAWAVAFSPDGRVLATGSDDTEPDDTIKLWDAATGRLLKGWRADPGMVAALAFAPDGWTLAAVTFDPTDNVRLYDVATGHMLARLEGHTDRVRTVAYTRDGSRLASAGSDRAIRLWDGRTGRPLALLTGHTDTVRGVAWSTDGKLLASASNDQTVRLWDVTDGGRETRRFEGVEKFAAVEFSPGGSLLAAADEAGGITLWDWASGARRLAFRGDDAALHSLAFSPDGRELAAAGASGEVRLWDTRTGQELLSLPSAGDGQVNSLAFAPDGAALAACWHDGTVRIIRRHEEEYDHDGALMGGSLAGPRRGVSPGDIGPRPGGTVAH